MYRPKKVAFSYVLQDVKYDVSKIDMAKQVHPYHIIEDICKEHNINLSLMAGATINHAAFRMILEGRDKTVAYGACTGTVVTLGITTTMNRQEFDLHHPDSISELIEYIKAGKMWNGYIE